MLYAYVGGRRLFGFLDFELGRQMSVEDLEWYSFDGLKVRIHTPWHLAVEAHGGLVVRDSSDLGSPTQEPDGTSSSQCQAFSSETGGFVDSPECAQRQQIMPTFGVAVATEVDWCSPAQDLLSSLGIADRGWPLFVDPADLGRERGEALGHRAR